MFSVRGDDRLAARLNGRGFPVERYLAVELASTLRHDGDGGVADDLASVAGLAEWVREQARGGSLEGLEGPEGRGFVADEAARAEVVAVRQAVRALFARAVRPAPPSPADANRLLAVPEAIVRLNEAAARVPFAPELEWPDQEEGPPRVRQVSVGSDAT